MRVRELKTQYLAMLLTILLGASATMGEPDTTWRRTLDQWFIMEINDEPAGYMHSIVETTGEQFRTVNEQYISIKRFSQAIEIEMSTTFVETADHTPISIETTRKMSQGATTTTWTFHDEHIMQRTVAAGRTIEKQKPFPEGEWLTPRAVHEYWLKRREADAENISYRTIMPDQGLAPVNVTSTLIDEHKAQIGGRMIPVTVWETSISALPTPFIEKYSVDGYVVHTEMNMGGMRMVGRSATKAEALALNDEQAPELLVSTFVEPDRPIENIFKTTRIRYRVRSRNGKAVRLPSTGAQRVRPDGDDAVIVDVNLDQPQPATGDERRDAAYRERSATIDSGDELVVKLAKRALHGVEDDDLITHAEILRAFVYEYISKKGLATAFAGASETARTRKGDCSEHAVLLAAMLRARNIPARVATGLLYVDEFAGEKQIFGWHMWTQALIDGKWIDLDATLPTHYHAGHILTGVSSLSENTLTAEFSSILQLMGNIDIEVMDVTSKRKTKVE